jgi:hypothetical protein
MKNSEINAILFEHMARNGMALKRNKNGTLYSDCAINFPIPGVAGCTWTFSHAVSRRWGGLKFTPFPIVNDVPVVAFGTVHVASLGILGSNFMTRYDPWCERNEPAIRTKLDQLVRFLRDFEASLSIDLARLPLNPDDLVFGKKALSWYPWNLRPPSPPAGPIVPKSPLEITLYPDGTTTATRDGIPE